MSKMLFLFLLLITASAVQAAPGATGDEQTKIGVILPLTGPFATYGERIRSGITRFETPAVRFIFEDEACESKAAVTAHKKLTGVDSVKVIIGPWCGSPQMAVAPMVHSAEQVAILGSSAPEAVWNASHGRMFSTQPTIEREAAFVAKELNRRGVESVVILFKENQFSRAHEAGFRKEFKGKILETLAYTSDTVSELKALALRVRVLAPAAIFVPDAFPLMAGLVQELRGTGLGALPVYSVYSAQSREVLEKVGRFGEGLVYSHPDIEGEAFEHYPAVAAEMAVKAVTECGSDVSCIRDSLKKHYEFDAVGALVHPLVMKTIKNEAFVRIE